MNKIQNLNRCLTVLFCLVLCVSSCDLSAKDNKEIYPVTIHDLPPASSIDYPEFDEWLSHHPRVRAQRMTALKVQSIERGGLMMTIAGGTAPDILRVYHHEAKSWVRNGFFEKLDKYIYKDTDGDGKYTHNVDEVIWKPFLNIPDQIRENFILEDGHIYYLPRFQWTQFLVYRRDIFEEAGLDPDKRFETFDEMMRACRILTDPKAKIPGSKNPCGRKGMGLSMNGWMFQAYLYAMGGRSLYNLVTCPSCKETIKFPQGKKLHKCPKCGASLDGVKVSQKAGFDGKEGERAMKFWQDLMWAPFVKSPYSGEPVQVGKSGEELTYPLEVTCPKTGKTFTVKDRWDVVEGCARRLIDNDKNWAQMWANGEICITNHYNLYWLRDIDIDPSVVGIMPIPEGGGASAFHYYGIYSGAKNRKGGEDRVKVCADMILDYVSQFYVPKDSPDYLKYHKKQTEYLVNNGFFRLCSTEELKAAGLEEYANEISVPAKEMRKLINDPKHYTFLPISEGYSRVQNEVFGKILLSHLAYDPKYDIKANLEKAKEIANTQVFMKDELVQKLMVKYSKHFWLIIVVVLGVIAFVLSKVLLKKTKSDEKIIPRNKISFNKRVASLLLLLPATALILLWAYYPLVRGSTMAFQDVKVLGNSIFVGFENFIRAVTNPMFPAMLKATFIYVVAMLSLGFMAPVFLAIMLSEVKRGSILLRAIYYSPYLLGGVVVLFIWKIFYLPTDEGLFNSILSIFGIGPVRWLQNPLINKWAIAIPGIWATMGSACLVYLAALKGIDESTYEAADIDGAGAFRKMIYITLPSLKPLLIINFVGAFIAAFHNMGNILVLTGGAYETNVIGLQIFLEAFNYLRFGTATALAWLLGSLLIGFTIYQLNFLKKVEFRKPQ